MVIVRLKAIAEPKGWYLNKIQKATGLDIGVLRRYWYWEEDPPKVESLHIPTLETLCDLLQCDWSEMIVRLLPTVQTSGAISPTGNLVVTHIPAKKSE